MKKLLYPVIFLFAIGFTSCKKCTTCKIVTANFETYPEEECGTSNELDDFEDSYREQATEMTTMGSRAECTRN